MIDHFHRDLPGLRLLKGIAVSRIQRAPGRLVNLGPQRPLELFIRLVRACEIGVPAEEALVVVIGVHKPAAGLSCG